VRIGSVACAVWLRPYSEQTNIVTVAPRQTLPVLRGGPSRALEPECEDRTVSASNDEHEFKKRDLRDPENRQDEQFDPE